MFRNHVIVTIVHDGNNFCLGASTDTSWVATMRFCDSRSIHEPSTVFVQAGLGFASVDADNASNCGCYWLTGSQSANGLVKVGPWIPGRSQWVDVF
jgi:hypothetical protein